MGSSLTRWCMARHWVPSQTRWHYQSLLYAHSSLQATLKAYFAMVPWWPCSTRLQLEHTVPGWLWRNSKVGCHVNRGALYHSFDIGVSLTLAVQVNTLTSVLLTITMAEAGRIPWRDMHWFPALCHNCSCWSRVSSGHTGIVSFILMSCWFCVCRSWCMPCTTEDCAHPFQSHSTSI